MTDIDNIEQYVGVFNVLAEDYCNSISESWGNISHDHLLEILPPSYESMKYRLGQRTVNPLPGSENLSEEEICGYVQQIEPITGQTLTKILEKWFFVDGEDVERATDADEKAKKCVSALQPLLIDARVSHVICHYPYFYGCTWDDILIESPLGDFLLALTLSD